MGANIGNHSLFFAKICNFSQCHAFEPNPVALHVLERNIEINSLRDKVNIIPKGVGEKNCKMTLGNIPYDNIGKTTLETGGDIEIIALDQLNLKDVDCIKIYTEGMSLAVLMGAEKTIVQNKPVLFIELWDNESQEINTF